MRLNRGHALGLATLSGFAIASCNLALGLGGYDFTHGGGGSGGSGTGGRSPSTSSSSTGSSSTSTSTASSGGGHGGTGGGTGGQGGMGAGPGTPVWTTALGTGEDDSVNAIAVGSNGHVYLTGKVGDASALGCPPAAPMTDAGVSPTKGGYLIEIDPTKGDGALNQSCVRALLFGEGAYGTDVAIDADGNVLLVGNFTNKTIFSATVDANLGPSYAFAVKLAPDLSAVLWTHMLVGDGTNSVWANGVASSKDSDRVRIAGTRMNKLVVDGTDFGMADGKDGVLLQCPLSTGVCQKADQVRFFGTAGSEQQLRAVAALSTDDFAVAGSSIGAATVAGFAKANPAQSMGNAMLATRDGNGNYGAAMLFGGGAQQSGAAVGQHVAFGPFAGADAGAPAPPVYLAGTFSGNLALSSTELMSAGGDDVFIGRFMVDACTGSTNCAATNAISLGSALGSETLNGLAVDSTGNVIVVGSTLGPITFGSDTADYVAGLDVYVAKMGPQLAPVWIRGFGATDLQAADAVAVAAGDSIVIAGHYRGDFKYGSQSLLPTATNTDIFVMRLRP